MTQISAARSRKRLVFALLIAAAIGAVFVYLKHTPSTPSAADAGSTAAAGPGGRRAGPGMSDPNAAVSVAAGTASAADVPVIQQALGTVIPNYSVTVTSRVDGELMAVYFTEGQYVKKGQLLAQIDPRAYQATLDQYQGEMAQNQALLKSAQLTVERYKRLFAKDSIAKQDLDTQTATVGQYAGAVKADEGQINAAKLNLVYAKIVSPIDGYVGLRLVDPGNIVSSSSTTGIVTVTQTNPIAVTFSLPQAQLATLLPKVRKGESLSVQALDPLGTTPLANGTLKFISNEIDTATGSIKLKALFENPDEKLYPNQFVNVKLTTDILHNAVVVPSAAVQLSSDGEFLYVVKDGKVTRRSVKVGPAMGGQRVITQGVDKGEQVVTRGIDHLREGSKVEVEKPAEQAAAQSATPATGNVAP
ncbi:MdtA/MuxA family multidrug efflux RND transporter periplasmic adaptor subunit [Pseudomonas sp. LP_7_YM]|uniref:MdtA/MuxA family multidrug efflux RND transporter periplasmic adaptor subunit n=1 Tax=Pseudomonas sp. LP_7_YM TaxID=2485137 RepID=UPI00105C69E2|nr:MdtA/MuxA family multidrug efflux RND transporter periplasmic adaptor subunit [Pseudomonas sp. LP_7_YM]TDV60813.1 multidrug efflux system membrane fusion protein [Pseudomonas sp. LP_7_YM]